MLGDDVDVVYVVRPGDGNSPLRYSLRSLVNLPHRRVWLAGHRPTWVSHEVGHVATVQGNDRFANSTRNLEAAASHPEVAERFVYMNDDFYVMEPVDEIPLLHRARVHRFAAHLRAKWGREYPYLTGMLRTGELLASLGIDDPLCYEVHTPMMMTKTRLLEALDIGYGTRPLHKRTLYGNLFHDPAESTLVDDPKIAFGAQPSYLPTPFLSTGDRAWSGATGKAVRRQFAAPSRYEKVPASRAT